ncbi:hypothetical protein ES319_A07G110600v1 [Gossypium barbadense]|uniref:Uncharacterized protein n=1 Tax=Gossypium barbadense TaxID=3634 RepID=A0A5J5V2L7_GOSBA|nr:hypothetical protein ES319_A07G110600v1 [Gossypium barbadense]
MFGHLGKKIEGGSCVDLVSISSQTGYGWVNLHTEFPQTHPFYFHPRK